MCFRPVFAVVSNDMSFVGWETKASTATHGLLTSHPQLQTDRQSKSCWNALLSRIQRKKMQDVMTTARAAVENRWPAAPLANKTPVQSGRVRAVAGLRLLPRTIGWSRCTETAVEITLARRCCDWACRNGTTRTAVEISHPRAAVRVSSQEGV
jgi:hypothetical protein